MKTLYIFLLALILSTPIFAQIGVINSPPLIADTLAQRFVGYGLEISNAQLTCGDGGSGYFFGGDAAGFSMNSGILLTSGTTAVALSPNGSGSATAGGGPGSALLEELPQTYGDTYNACTLEFDFTPQGDTIKFNFVYGSEEYPEYVGTAFNDIFAFIIDGQPEYPPEMSVIERNIATIPGNDLGIQIAVNTLNHLAYNQFYVDNSDLTSTIFSSIQYDGFTTNLTAKAKVTPCNTYHLTMAVADVGDAAWDSGVFLEEDSFISNTFVIGSDIQLEAEGANFVVESCEIEPFAFSTEFPSETGYSIPLLTSLSGNNPNTIVIGGTAMLNTDYTLSGDFATIPSNETMGSIDISPIEDNLTEGDEFITFSFYTYCNNFPYQIDTVWIYDAVHPIVNDDINICSSGTEVELSASESSGMNFEQEDFFIRWEPSQGLSCTDCLNPIATVDATTTYTFIMGYDGTNCSEQKSVTIEMEGFPVIEVEMEAVCEGEITSATANITGGQAPYQISWSNGDTGETASNLGANVFYNILVTDANGCLGVKTFLVEALTGIEAVQATTLDEACGQENGRISLQVVGGTPPYTYNWNTNETGSPLENLAAGIYTVLVTDIDGCTALKEVELKETEGPSVSIEVSNANCNEANGQATAIVTGGTPPYFFEWNSGTQTSMESDLSAGTYTVIITDSNDCKTIGTAAISDEGAPDASFSAPLESCISDGSLLFTPLQNTTGTFAVAGEDIEGNVWTPNETGEFSITYTIVQDGCTSIEEQTVVITDVFDAEWTIAGNVFDVCASDLPLTILANNTTGTWFTDEGSEILVETDLQDNKTITFTAELGAINADIFLVTYNGGETNCGNTYSKTIRIKNTPKIPEIIGETEICGVENAPKIALNGFPDFCNCPTTFNVYNGAGNVLKQGQTFNNDVFDTAPFVSGVGVYTFEVASVNVDCESERAIFTMEVYEEVEASVEAVGSCDNESGEAVVTVLNGNAPFGFEWSNGAITSAINNLPPAVYEVQVTDANNCSTEKEVTVETLAAPVLDLGEDIVQDEGTTVLLESGISGGVAYLWSTGETSSSILVNEPGTYSLTVFTLDGCLAADEIEVTFVTDIAAIEGLNEWVLYPNPASDFVLLQFDLLRSITATIEVFDITGRQWFSQELQLSNSNKQLSVSTKDFPIGVYLVVLKDEKGMAMKKLVKK